MRRKAWWAAVLVVLLLLGAGGAGLVVALGYPYQLLLSTRLEEPGRVTFDLTSSDGVVFAVRGGAPGRAVELAQIPRHLVDAVLAMEDRRFFAHAGMDLRGVIRAAFANLDAGGTVQGGSTITQQLAKNLFLTSERTWARKLQEMMLALWLERRLSKEEILARYLNTVYLGAGAYGVEAASQRYFGTPVEQLTLAQSAMLAGLIQAPSRFAPTRSLDEAQRRARIVLDAMVDAGSIDAAAAEEAKAHPAKLAVLPVEQVAYGYAADFAAAEAHAMLGGVGGNFAVATTIDRRLQLLAERTVDDWLAREGDALAVASGGAGRHGAGWRGPGDGGRPRLRAEPVQSRRAGAAPAGLAVQAVRLSRRAARGHVTRQPGRGRSPADRRLAAAGLCRPLSGPDRPAHGIRAVAQYRRRPAAGAGGARAGDRARQGDGDRIPVAAAPEPRAGQRRGHPARAHRRLCRRARRCPPGRAVCRARRAGARRRDLPAAPDGIPTTGLAETGDHGSPVRGGALRHRQRRRPRRAGVRQDRDDAGPPRCLVHRLHRGSRGRRVGRQRRPYAR